MVPQKCQYHPNLGPVSKYRPSKYGTSVLSTEERKLPCGESEEFVKVVAEFPEAT